MSKQVIKANVGEIIIPLPTGYVLVEEARLVKLESNEVKGYWWGITDVLQRINRGRTWFTENVLYSARWRKQIDVENGGFVYYPSSQGDKFSFLPSETIEFLENNFSEILKHSKNYS